MATRLRTRGALALLSLLVLVLVACVTDADARSKGSKGDKTYPLYVNGAQVLTNSLLVQGELLTINPGPAKNGSFSNGTTVTLTALHEMVWAGDCGRSVVSTTCSVFMDRARYVLVSAVPPPTPTPTPRPTATPTSPPAPASGGGSGSVSSAIDILSPAWYEAFSVAPGQTLSRHVAVQKPAGTTHWCSKTRVNYDGTYPFASDLTVTSGCEITWTPSSTTPLGRYEAGLQVSFQGSTGSVTHYRVFYVDVTNNPPAPDTTPVTNQVLGAIVGGSVDPTSSIDALYNCIGGEASWLGSPVSGPYPDPNNGKPKQDFQNGFIQWADGEWNHYYTVSFAHRSVYDFFLAPQKPVCVQDLHGQKLSIANTYNRIGGQLEKFAALNSLEVEVALAVWEVESSTLGGFAGPNGQPTIRFENHIFWNEWGYSHPEVGRYFNNSLEIPGNGWIDQWFCSSACDPYADPATARSKGWRPTNPEETPQVERYQALERAKALDVESAYRSISMGGPQIMGFNYGALVDPRDPSGQRYASAAAMFEAFSQNEFSHVKGFFDFLNFKGVITYAQQKNWVELAFHYNGEARDDYKDPGADAYKEKLPIAYDAAREVLKNR